MTTINIDGDIGWEVEAKDIKEQLSKATGDLIINVNSRGGSIFEGLEIYNAIKSYDKGKVTAKIGALAASMGSIIPLAADTVEGTSTSTFMIHNGSTLSHGDHNNLRKDADIIEALSNMMIKIYSDKTGKSESEIKSLMDKETYFFGDEILANGFIDSQVSSSKDDALDRSTAIAFASEKVRACLDSYKKHSGKEENQKISAYMTQKNLIVGEISKKDDIIATEYKTKKGISMDTTIEQEHLASVEKAIALDRKRTSDIMALNCSKEQLQKAIEDGTSAGDLAYALQIKGQTEILATKKAFEQSGVSTNMETPEETKDITASQKEDEEVNEALAKYKKGMTE
tara:strand:+ start:694 stop:1719 length:1026 start_codon:yes stop_codon:yes gene_type:complete